MWTLHRLIEPIVVRHTVYCIRNNKKFSWFMTRLANLEFKLRKHQPYKVETWIWLMPWWFTMTKTHQWLSEYFRLHWSIMLASPDERSEKCLVWHPAGCYNYEMSYVICRWRKQNRIERFFKYFHLYPGW